jgi:UDP-N-acetylglucosamine 2-epimerase (non-hydrolysing)
MTDSGGIQEEACYLGKPLIILREKTERPEVLQNEHVYLVGTAVETILRAVEQVRLQAFNSRKRRVRPYGEGDASTRIINALRVRFQQ